MKTRILVVEDEGITRKDIANRLSDLGYEVTDAVGTAEEALCRAQKSRPDLVLMDIILAGEMDGIACAQQMRLLLDVPVVYLTALADRLTLDRAKVTGAFGYLLKPFDQRDLQPAIEMAMYKHEMERKLKETQELLIQSEKMASVGNLASGIAHEIRNPLGIILSGIECISTMDLDNPHFQTALEKMRVSVSRANKIIIDLLKFSRPSKIEFTAVELKLAVTEALSLVEPRAKVAGIRLGIELCPEDCCVNGDISLLRQVFFNLLSNSLDACASGCEVSVKVGRVTGNEQRDAVVVEVADTGSGIEQSALNRIFDPFFTTKEPGKGVGLGLSITHMIVERHGGSIKAYSELGKGTRFVITLPVCAAVPSASPL